MRDERELRDYEVGYRKPPKGGQFKKGVSGNSSGRPKKLVDFQTNVMKELHSTVVINENGNRKIITKAVAIAKQAVNKAASGNIQFMRLTADCSRQALEKMVEQEQTSADDLDRKVREMSDYELLSYIIADVKKSTSASQMAAVLAEVVQLLDLAKPEFFGLPPKPPAPIGLEEATVK